MKRIEAIIRPAKVADVCRALKTISHDEVTISSVEGRGSGQGWTHHVRSASFTDSARERSRLEIVVRDEDAGRVIGAILEAAATGGEGDGEIFVHELADAIRIGAGAGMAAV